MSGRSRQKAAERNDITIDRLTNMLIEDRDSATAGSAVTALARLHGLMIDRLVRQPPKRSMSDYTNDELLEILGGGLGHSKELHEPLCHACGHLLWGG